MYNSFGHTMSCDGDKKCGKSNKMFADNRNHHHHHHHHISFVELGHLLTRSGPEAKGSNPTTGLTLLWARNPFRGNFNHW